MTIRLEKAAGNRNPPFSDRLNDAGEDRFCYFASRVAITEISFYAPELQPAKYLGFFDQRADCQPPYLNSRIEPGFLSVAVAPPERAAVAPRLSVAMYSVWPLGLRAMSR